MDIQLSGDEAYQEQVVNPEHDLDTLNTSVELPQEQENDYVLAKIYPNIKLEAVLSKINQNNTKLQDLLTIKIKEIDVEDLFIKNIKLLNKIKPLSINDNTVYSSFIDEVAEKVKSKEIIRPPQFLLLAFNFKLVLDEGTYEESIKGVNWSGIHYIIEDLTKLLLIGRYITEEQSPNDIEGIQWYGIRGERESEENKRQEFEGVCEIIPLIKNTICKLETAHDKLKKEYIVSKITKESCFLGRELWEEILSYFTDTELKAICVSIRSFVENYKEESLIEVQEMIRKLEVDEVKKKALREMIKLQSQFAQYFNMSDRDIYRGYQEGFF